MARRESSVIRQDNLRVPWSQSRPREAALWMHAQSSAYEATHKVDYYARVGVALGSNLSLQMILAARFTQDPRDDEIVTCDSVASAIASPASDKAYDLDVFDRVTLSRDSGVRQKVV